MEKPEKNATIVLQCFNIVAPMKLVTDANGFQFAFCRAKIIITQFHNGVFRFLCPKCGKISFGQQKDSGMEVLKGYSQYIYIE